MSLLTLDQVNTTWVSRNFSGHCKDIITVACCRNQIISKPNLSKPKEKVVPPHYRLCSLFYKHTITVMENLHNQLSH